MTREATVQGVSDLWEHVNHIAIVVSDVGRSLAFYTHVVGMTQVMRPNFDRYRISRYIIKYITVYILLINLLCSLTYE